MFVGGGQGFVLVTNQQLTSGQLTAGEKHLPILRHLQMFHITAGGCFAARGAKANQALDK